jgi:hypothetical protein
VKVKFQTTTYWIVITNADNYYIPQFFNHLLEWKGNSNTNTDSNSNTNTYTIYKIKMLIY